MTYIRVDSNYYDIDTLSRMISVPQRKIEEIINRGMSSIEDSFLTDEAILMINKMRFATFISSAELDTDITSELIKSYQDQDVLNETLTKYLSEERITTDQYDLISNWI